MVPDAAAPCGKGSKSERAQTTRLDLPSTALGARAARILVHPFVLRDGQDNGQLNLLTAVGQIISFIYLPHMSIGRKSRRLAEYRRRAELRLVVTMRDRPWEGDRVGVRASNTPTAHAGDGALNLGT